LKTKSKIKERFPFLHRIVLLHFILLSICLVGLLIDDRQLMGINVWLKPTKFILSSIIFLWTIAWYLLVYPFREKTKNFIAASLSIFMFAEILIITTQAGRGVLSHYNQSSPLDGIAFGIMGLAIGLITLIVFWFFIKSFSPQLNFSNSMKWNFRISWFTFLFASYVGGQMIGQLGHHFFGIHGIQIIPLVAFYFSQKIKNNTLTNILSIGFALLYLGWIAFTFFQAKQGQPLLSF